MPHLNLFISHRHEDYKIAKKFRDEFERISGPACNYFLAEEIRKGDAWRGRIVDTLDKADWFILLFTDPSQNWGWCMFEAGQFEASILKRPGRGRKERRLICIHSPQAPRPDPLEPFQGVFASPDDFVSLVREFSEIVNPAIFKTKPDLLYEIAGNVCEQIKKPEVLFQSNSLTLTVLSNQNPTKNKIPPTAIIRGDRVTFRELFALLGGQFKWEKVETAARKKLDTRWLPELTRAVHAANTRKNFSAIQATISNADSTRYYRPVIRKVTYVFTEFTDDPLGKDKIKRIESALRSLEKINIELSILSSERFANLIRDSYLPND